MNHFFALRNARLLWRVLSFCLSRLPQAALLVTIFLSWQHAARAAGADSTDGALTEIVVTAERRESSVQGAPLSITAISGDELQRRGITSVADLVHAVPGIAMRSGGPGQTELEIRGLSSTGGASATVGFYLDDAALSAPAQSLNGKVVVDPDLYDLERIEVLRGPQGTLYGSGSEGGTVRLITAEPKLNQFMATVEVDGSGTVGGGPNGAINGVINLPISDAVALRAVVTEKYNSGWIDRIVENPFPFPTNSGCAPTTFFGCARGNVSQGGVVHHYRNVNWEVLQGGRVELLIEPSPALKILTTLFYQQIRQGGYNTFDSPPGSAGTQAHYQPADVAEPFNDQFALVSNTVTYKFDFADLSAATSFWTRRERQIQDASELYQNLFFLPTFLPASTQSLGASDPSHQFSEEIRLASKGEGPFKWIGGVFFSDFHSNDSDFGTSPELCAAIGGCPNNPTGLTYYDNDPYHIRQSALFGEASYDVTKDIEVTAGLRYFHFQNSLDFSQAGLLAPSGTATATTGSVRSTNSGVTPKLNASYKPTDTLTIYGTVAQGFRPGGVNLPAPTSGPASCLPALSAEGLTASPLTFDPDKVWSYEIGEKAKLFDNRLTVNGDVYYIRWQGVQQQVVIPGCGYLYNANAGNAASYGPELELSYRLTDALTIEANGTYTHATLTSVTPGAGFNVGDRLLNIPRYTENTSIAYRLPVMENNTLTLRLSNSLVGPTRDQSYSKLDLPSYDILNARAELSTGAVRYSLYANNLTNKHAEITSNTTNITINQPSLIRYATNQPLTIGFNVRYTF